MSSRKLIWHIGTAHAPRALIPANLAAHRETLAASGVAVAAGEEESSLVTHELLRTHRQAGLRRRDVEGGWARVCDRVWQHKGVSVLSTPDLCVADKDQLNLALDPLIGLEVHLVLTVDTFSQQLYGGWLAELRSGRSTGWDKYVARVLSVGSTYEQGERFWGGHDLPALLGRWGWTLRADRVHVLAPPRLEDQWDGLLDLVGVGAPRPAPVLPPYADPAGVAVLRRVNGQLDGPLSSGAMSLLTTRDSEGSAMPAISTEALRPRVRDWVERLTAAGHDVRGDLELLIDEAMEQAPGTGPDLALPGPNKQLTVAVEALAEALAETSRLQLLVAELEADQRRQKRRRRKLKRKLARLVASGP